jgi:hypothetical protein
VERTDRIRNFTADELVAFSRAFALPVLWFFLPPNLPAEEELRIASPGVPEDEALTAGPYLEAILSAPERPAALTESLDELERDHPGEMEARYFALLRNVSQVASLSAIKNTVTGIKRRAQGLHDLATMLDEAAEQTEDRMADALDRLLTQYHEEGPGDAPSASGHAGPR